MADGSAPGSSANIGPVFDHLAIAFEMRTSVTATSSQTWEGPALAVRAAEAAAPDHGPLRLEVSSEVPVARGLGSSAALAAASALAARRAHGLDEEQSHIFQVTGHIEGHLDQAAAAVYGGCVLIDPGGEPVRLHISPNWSFVLAIPDEMVPTLGMRVALPESLELSASARNAGRAVAMGAALVTGDAELLSAAGGDELHEPVRLAAQPLARHLIESAIWAGAAHASLSGSGSTILAICESDDAPDVAQVLADRINGQGSVVVPTVALSGLV